MHSFLIVTIYTIIQVLFAVHCHCHNVTCTHSHVLRVRGTYPIPTPVQADSTGPQFQSLFASTQQSIDVSLSLLRLQLHRESLINLLAIAQDITNDIKLVSFAAINSVCTCIVFDI